MKIQPAALSPAASRRPHAKSRGTVLVQLNSLSLGGTQINAIDLASAMTRHGYDSVLIGPRDTLPAGPSLLDIAKEKGVRLEIFERPKKVISGARDLSRRARDCGADIVHVYGSGGARSAYWGPALLARRALVLTVYEMTVSPTDFVFPPLIVGTGYLVDHLRQRPGHTRLISPPVDLDRDRSDAADASGFLESLGCSRRNQLIVVLVTRLDEEMKALSVETAINAVARSKRRDLVLIIVGAGDAEGRLRTLGTDVNSILGRRAIVFAGPLADPRAAYASADIALGMGGSAARALAFGKPLIVQGEFGWSKAFRPETAEALFRNSFWSDHASLSPVEDLMRDIENLAADEEDRSRLASFGRQFSAKNFGLDAMAARLAEVYDIARRDYHPLEWASDLNLEVQALGKRLNRWRAGR